MEPEEFEAWVLGRLRKLGYLTNRTPRSWDAGADGLAQAPPGSGLPNLLIQCKHTQGRAALGLDAVSELLRAKSAYAMGDNCRLLVVTNAQHFSASAQRAATEGKVLLFTVRHLEHFELLRQHLLAS